jgi:hypothetical protein
LFILGGYIFANKKIKKKDYFVSSILFAIGTYLIRMLPIHFGVHIIIISMLYILITISINKIYVIQAISSSMILIITLSTFESLNAIILNEFKIDMKLILNNPLKKMLYFSPSLILFALSILIIKLLMYKNKKEDTKNVLN